MQCPRQTSPIIQPQVCYIHTAVPHASYKLNYTVRRPAPKRKKFGPSLTGDINIQSSCWNNGKMKIAYNTAYVQTFTGQPLLCISISVPTSKKLLCQMPNITVQAGYHLPIILNYILIASEELNMTIYSTAVLISDKLAKTYVSQCEHQCTHNLHYAKFPCRLPKLAQTAPKRCTPGNATFIAMMSHNIASL